MKGLEICIYILFALAIFFAFGLIIFSAIFLLIAFLLIDRVKKYDKEKAKKLNYIGIAIIIFAVVMYFLSGLLAYSFISRMLSGI